MAVTLTTSGSINTTIDDYGIAILSTTSSVNVGAISLVINVPNGFNVKNVKFPFANSSGSFNQLNGRLYVAGFDLVGTQINTNDVVLEITASGLLTGSFSLDTEYDWNNQFASSSAEAYENYSIRMPELLNPSAILSNQTGFTIGVNTRATNVGSFAGGVGTLASGYAAHAFGVNTTASGYAAFSTGVETDADGTGSFSMGSGSWARGTATVTMGIGTVASSSGQLVVGHYNETKTDINNLFVVGDGTGPSNANRRNIIEVYGGMGASFRGVKIDTATTPAITTTINGFNVYGRSVFHGGVTQSAGIITIDGDYGGGTHGSASYIAETYTSLGQLRGRTLLNYKGIDFNSSFLTSAPSSTHLWTNDSNRLFYGSDAIILNGGNTLGGAMTIGTNDTNNLQLETGGTTRVFISSSGNVGIGTTSPSSRLQVSLPANNSNNIFRSDAGDSLLTIQTFTTTNRMQLLVGDYNGTSSPNIAAINDSNTGIQWSGSDILRFVNNGTENVTINASGRVGIGTTSPSAQLHISGASNSGLLEIDSPKVNNIIYVSGSGNVGIGTSNPTYQLHVSASGGTNGTIYTSNRVIAAGGTAADPTFATNSTIAGLFEPSYANLGFTSYGGEAGRIETSNRYWNIGMTGGTAKMNIRGTGATSATNTLRVENSSGTPALIVQDDGRTFVGEDYTFTSAQRYYLLEASADGVLSFTNSTTSNGQTNGFLSGELYLNGTQPFTNHRAINVITTNRNTSTSNILRAFYASGRTGNSGAANTVAGFLGGVNIEGSGNVTNAIGLEIELYSQTNNKTITNMYGVKVQPLINSVGTITNTYGLYIDSLTAGTQSNAAYGIYQAGTDKNYFAGNLGIKTTSPSASLHISGASNSGLFEIDSPAVNNIIYASGSGNVGIGTGTPSARLHINGDTILSGSLYTYGANSDIDSGSLRTVLSVSTGSYRAAFFDYVLTSGSNARAGTVFSVWQGTSVEYADTSTNDIGNTSGVNLLVSMSGANIGLFASSSNDNWSMKALARLL